MGTYEQLAARLGLTAQMSPAQLTLIRDNDRRIIAATAAKKKQK